jgi:molybdopterin-containing oxidoreductase family iron-sulfur binding subunit
MLRNAEGELEAISWEDAIARLAAEIGKNPRSAHFLGGHPGDTLSALMDRIVEGMGASRTVFETFAHEALSAASEQVFGAEAVPVFDLTDADLVIDFGSEVLDTGLSPTEHQRQLADARDTDKHPGGGARLVYVGSRLSLTASSADEWLPAVPGSEGLLALALAKVALGAGGDASLASAVGSVDVRQAAEASGIPADAIERIGRAIAKGTRVVALPPGPAVKSRRAIGATAAVLVLNAVAGAVGTGMTLAATTDKNRPNYRDVLALAKQMQDGAVSVLVVHGADPVYGLPKAAGFVEALDKVGFVVSTASAPDDTSAHAHLILPDHTPLESWGDLRPRDGVRGLVQPSIRPLYNTRSFGDVLFDTARVVGGAAAAAAPAGDFRTVLENAWCGRRDGHAYRCHASEALRRGGVHAPRFPAQLLVRRQRG